MKKFYTGYLCFSHEIIDMKPLRGFNFHLSFEDTINNRDQTSTKELIINASNEHSAIEIASLIFSAIVLIHSTYPIFIDEPLYPTDIEDRKKLDPIKGSTIFSISGIYDAARIVISCSKKRIYKNALLKYWIGCSLHSNEPIDLDPHHSEYHSLEEYRTVDHIRMGYAIVVYYSVLEELGLEIQASQKKPSLLNSKWNPEVKIDLEKRLIAKNVNIKNQFVWTRRSTPTNIEKAKKTLGAKKTEWARYDIRDCYIEICDAIRIVSWMRSRIVSHKVDDSINSLSLYDVSNANHLARIILLDVFKIKT